TAAEHEPQPDSARLLRRGPAALVGPRLVLPGDVAPRRPGDLLGYLLRILRLPSGKNGDWLRASRCLSPFLPGRGLSQLGIILLPLGRALERGPGLLDFLENAGADFGVRPL